VAGPLNGTIFAVVDVETTGLKPESGDRVCELGAIKFTLEGERGRFSTLVNPERPMPPEVQKVHGISDEMVRPAPAFGRVAGAFERFMAGCVLVAQNASFDLKFLRAELQRVGRRPAFDVVVDTIALVKSYRSLEQYNLDRLAEHYGIPTGTRHRSVEDCAITMEVFRRAVRDLTAAGRVKSLADLARVGRPRA
jgi:DNA polymerase III epsilon subunit family exonuclease